MSMKYCGATLDLHGGGEDLIFPHHENEIAQSEGATGKRFVDFWVHNGWVTLGGDKMSKSTKKFRPIHEVVGAFHPEAVRLYLMSTHYRSPIEYSEERLSESETALARLKTPILEIRRRQATQDEDAEVTAGIERAHAQFEEGMADDFNSSRAVAALFDLAKVLNVALEKTPGEAGPALRKGAETLLELGTVLGLFWLPLEEEPQAPEAILAKVQAREDARRTKDWARADALRAEVLAEGWVIEDRPDGPRVKRS